MITKKIDFNYTPLQINSGIKIDGRVPATQVYDSEFKEFTPNYTIVPLTLKLWASVVDQDHILTDGDISRDLTNIKWTIVEDGVKTTLGSNAMTTHYTAVHNDTYVGALIVMRNARPDHPLSIRVSAEYVDRRTNQIHTISQNMFIRCDAVTQAKPTLYLDIAQHSVYNPLTEEMPDLKNVTVHASLRANRNSSSGLTEAEVKEENRYFVWLVQREDNSFSALGDVETDYFATISTDGTFIVVDRELMGDSVTIKCVAAYDPNGTPTEASLTANAPSAMFTIVRHLPFAEFTIEEQMADITPHTTILRPRAVGRNVNGEIDNLEQFYTPLWYTSTDGVNMKFAGSGEVVEIPTNTIDSKNGALLGLDVKEVGPLFPVEIEGNTLWQDSDGSLILIM